MNSLQPKPAIRSLTIQSGIATSVSGVISAIALFSANPSNYEKTANCLNAFGLSEWGDAVLKVSASLPMILGVITIAGRIRARRWVYTPDGVPGANKPRL